MLLRPAMPGFCHGKPVWGDRVKLRHAAGRVKDFVSRGKAVNLHSSALTCRDGREHGG
jgi:hypothetical protein